MTHPAGIGDGDPGDGFDPLPAVPVQLQPTYAGALAAFEKAPPVRALFANGAGTSPTRSKTAGDPYPAYEHSFACCPCRAYRRGRGTSARRAP